MPSRHPQPSPQTQLLLLVMIRAPPAAAARCTPARSPLAPPPLRALGHPSFSGLPRYVQLIAPFYRSTSQHAESTPHSTHRSLHFIRSCHTVAPSHPPPMLSSPTRHSARRGVYILHLVQSDIHPRLVVPPSARASPPPAPPVVHPPGLFSLRRAAAMPGSCGSRVCHPHAVHSVGHSSSARAYSRPTQRRGYCRRASCLPAVFCRAIVCRAALPAPPVPLGTCLQASCDLVSEFAARAVIF
jgi:hypothetical protein